MPEKGGSLNKKFITIFVFFGLFATLLATMPNEYLQMGVGATVQDKEAVAFFSSQNVTIYNNTVLINMTSGTHQEIDWGLPSPEKVEFRWDTDIVYLTIQVRHLRKKFLGFWYGWHRLKVQEPYRSLMHDPDLEQWMREQDIVTNFFSVESNSSYVELAGDIIIMKLFVKPTLSNETMQEAWDNGRLTLYSTYNIDWSQTSTGAWGVLMQMLTFQSPTFGLTGVFGSIISALITLSLWGSIALIAFAIITALLPFVSGWGGD